MKKGFILFYAMMIMVVLSILTLILYNSALQENVTSKAELDSLKAFYAADTGIECAVFWEDSERAFTEVNITPQTYSCGTTNFTVNGVDLNCVSTPVTFTIAETNGTCANVTVTTKVLSELPDGTKVCSMKVVSSGKNTANCQNATVERIRFETR